MLFRNNKFFKKFNYSRAIVLAVILLLTNSQIVWAAGPHEPSIFSNSLAVMLLIIILILLIVIAVLANVLLGAAEIKLGKRKKENEQKNKISQVATVITVLLLISN